MKLFESDYSKYTFVTIDNIIIEQARLLITKYGTLGLRTLDSIQLSSAVALIQDVEVFYTADYLLKSLFETEGLQTEITK